MLDTVEQKISGNGNVVAGGDIILTEIINNENHIVLYEDDIVNVIKQFDEHMDLFDENTYALVEGGKYDFAEKEKKNILNNLSDEYFEIIKEEFLPYFYKIDDFLKNPQNKKIQQTYKKVSLRLKTTIQANRRKFNCFEEILSDISNTLSKADKSNVEPLVVMVFLNYMYWNCDIGRKK